MNKLLISLGKSPWIIAEAILTAKTPYDSVEVITSETVDLTVVETFLSENRIPYQIEIVKGLRDLDSQSEQDAFEEALYRWYGGFIRKEDRLDVCISGGFKSMSGTLQKAAHLLGAREVFHILADNNPSSDEAVQAAIISGQVRRISMGPEPGWASLRRWAASIAGSGSQSVRIGIQRHLQTMRQCIDNPSEILRSESLPFPDLALLSPDLLEWLRQPLDSEQDSRWIKDLPKTELHCHLGGFATSGEELQAVREAAENPDNIGPVQVLEFPNGWPSPTGSTSLSDYMKLGNANGSTLLHDRGCLRQQLRLLYQYLVPEKILYAEIRCSPANYTRKGRTALEILGDIQEILEACRAEAKSSGSVAPRVNLIVIVTRKQSDDLSSVARHLALAVAASGQKRGCRVVGVDLAGFEDKETRPVYFQTDFNIAHRCGLAVTAHAGENDDVESIWQAVYQLSARRLGHALRLRDSADLLRVARDRGIGIEMCPYANYQIHGFSPMSGKTDYPLRHFLREGLKVSVNTDNPGISGAGLADNMLFLATLCPGLTRLELLQCIRNGFDTAFIEPGEKTHLLENASIAVFQACQNHMRVLPS